MNTVQMYAGKGHYSPFTPQMAQSAAKSPSTLDDRSVHPLTTEEIVLEFQDRLLKLVDSYLEWTSPILAITELLETWLTTPPKDLSNDHYKNQLGSVMRLIDFMTELRDAHDSWLTYLNTLRSEKEVSHE